MRRTRAATGSIVVALGLIASFATQAWADEPAEAEPASVADYDALITDSDREHWSFQPVRRSEPPAVGDAEWVRNPIDTFILERLESRGWGPNESASPAALLRRVHLDLTGLPPTLEEQEAFAADPTPAALDRVVEDLLGRPTYGERWARHWLDLVRFAESNGYEIDAAKPNAWRYRDYVISAFNNDKPYDRFIIEQLAGDELPDANAETLIATGYCRVGPWDPEPADFAQDRFDQLDDIVSTTSQVFLGLTVGCARCHNHKFDPITTLDYYRMVANFNGLVRPRNERDELVRPAGTPTEIAAVTARDQRIAELAGQATELRTRFQAEFLAGGTSGLAADVVAAFIKDPAERDEAQKGLVAANEQALAEKSAAAMPPETKAQLDGIDQATRDLIAATPDLPSGYFMEESSPTPSDAHVLIRGSAARPGIVAPPGVPVVLAAMQPEFLAATERSTRRRLSLAQWIASPENPLTARVIVNRVWQIHFGEALARTPSDFGIMGDEPTHPELLDWLADWFMKEGWSFKKLHRLMLTSNAWRMSRETRPEYAAADPESKSWWRLPYRRLEVEAICDSMLAVSGRLSTTMYGPSMYPHIPAEALAGHSDFATVWRPFDEGATSRRTIYAFVKRSLVVPMLEVLDFCDTSRTSPRRAVTCVAPQALTLFNGDFVNRQASHFAERLERDAGSTVGDETADRRIKLAYRLALCRLPSATEAQAMRDFLRDESARVLAETTESGAAVTAEEADHRALAQMCRVIFNLNEFMYPD